MFWLVHWLKSGTIFASRLRHDAQGLDTFIRFSLILLVNLLLHDGIGLCRLLALAIDQVDNISGFLSCV